MHAPTAGCTNSNIPKCGKHTCVHTHTQTETYAHTSGSWHSLYICVRCKHRDGVSSDSCLSDVDCRVCRVFTWKKHSWLPQCAVQSGETDRRKNSMRNVKNTAGQMKRRFSWINSTLFQLMNKTVKWYKPIYRANKIKQMACDGTVFIYHCFRGEKKQTNMQVLKGWLKKCSYWIVKLWK